MVETLNKDLGMLAVQDKFKGGSFLDVIGADTDSSFDKPITVQIAQDSYHISQGGQTVGQNANIQVQVDDDNCLHFLHKYGIVANLYVDHGRIENAAMLFDGLEMNIGNVSWNCSFQKYYSQQKLAKIGKQRMQYIANAMSMKYEDFAYNPHSNGELWVGSGANANVQVNNYQAYIRQLLNHANLRQEVDSEGNERTKIFVPLPCIFPALWELPDDGAIFTGLGQKLKFNLKTTQASESILSDGGGVPGFQLRNISLVRFYSKLDSIRSDLIMKATVNLPCLKYIHWQQGVLQPVTNAIFGISKQDRIKGLIFGFHSRTDAQNSNDASNGAVNLLNDTAAQFKYPLGYFPQMPIQQIDVDVGGHVYSINMSQLQLIHLSSYFGDQLETYTNPIQRQNKHAYYLDLTRFGHSEDLYGSSSKNITSVHVQITMKVGAGSRTLGGQQADWDAASFQNFGFFGYLETQQMFECRNGTYMQ